MYLFGEQTVELFNKLFSCWIIWQENNQGCIHMYLFNKIYLILKSLSFWRSSFKFIPFISLHFISYFTPRFKRLVKNQRGDDPFFSFTRIHLKWRHHCTWFSFKWEEIHLYHDQTNKWKRTGTILNAKWHMYHPFPPWIFTPPYFL